MLDQTHSGIDEFLYQNGGTVIGSGRQGGRWTAQPNIQALTYLKGLMTAGVMKFPSQVSAGWSGEAFGKNKAAMAIVGNWVVGAMQSDYPSIKYQVVPLPGRADRHQGHAGLHQLLGHPRPRRRTWPARSAS